MHKDYSNSIRNMIFSNENIKNMLFNNEEIDDYSNKIVTLEIFFLAFKIFEDEFRKLDIYDYWKELFIKQDYVIEGDKILFNGKEISYQLIEIIFIKLMLEYRKKRAEKVVDFTRFVNYQKHNEENDYSKKHDSEIFEIKPDNKCEEVIKRLDNYVVDKSKETKEYLSSISETFKNRVYDAMINLYNILKDARSNRMFMTNFNTISEDSRYLNDLIIFLLNLYPIHYYAKDKEFIRYDYLKMPYIYVDPNHFKFDAVWEMLTNRLEILNTNIELLIEARNRTRNMREIFRYNNRLRILEADKERVLNQILDIGEVRENILYDGEYIESFYSGELLNKHILYNLEIAINKGYVDFRRDVQGKEELVFYSINGNEVDFIMHIDLDKLYVAIDNMDIVSLFKTDNNMGRGLSLR